MKVELSSLVRYEWNAETMIIQPRDGDDILLELLRRKRNDLMAKKPNEAFKIQEFIQFLENL